MSKALRGGAYVIVNYIRMKHSEYRAVSPISPGFTEKHRTPSRSPCGRVPSTSVSVRSPGRQNALTASSLRHWTIKARRSGGKASRVMAGMGLLCQATSGYRYEGGGFTLSQAIAPRQYPKEKVFDTTRWLWTADFLRHYPIPVVIPDLRWSAGQDMRIASSAGLSTIPQREEAPHAPLS
jgi:hypothetical protein